MSKDIFGLKRYVSGYNKIEDKYGNASLEVEYELMPLNLSFLQELFNIDKNEPIDEKRDLAACYKINACQAKLLQPYVINGVIDVDKYNFMLESFDASTCEHSEEYLKAKAESENENL